MKHFKYSVFLCVLSLIISIASVRSTAMGADTPIFWIYPSGDTSGETDWANIIDTFEAAIDAGHGSTVEFAAGDFYVHKPIQIVNFSGTVKGQGKDSTNLHTAPGRLFGLLEYPLPPNPTYLILYFDSNWPEDQIPEITVSDMAFYIDGPSETWSSHSPDFHLNSSNVVSIRGTINGYDDPEYENFELTHLNATFQHLKAVADTGPEYLPFGSSILNNFQVWGEAVAQVDPGQNTIYFRWTKPVSGDYTFKDLDLLNSAYSITIMGAVDSNIRIGGSPKDRIYATGTIDMTELIDISNSTIEVSYLNGDEVVGGIWAVQGMQAAWANDLGEYILETLPDPSNYYFHHNTIISENGGEYAGFELWNPGGMLGQDFGSVEISNNKLSYFDHGAPFEAIFSFFIDDALVTNNTISGRGVAGIFVEPFDTPGGNWVLQGNNVNNYDAWLAPIYLGTGTYNCTVLGGNNSINVFDEGTDNILVGVNNQGGNAPGLILREAISKKLETMKSFP